MHGLVELLGALTIVVGAGVVTAAAMMVSVALGVLVAGVFLIIGGVVAVYVASVVEAANPKPGSDRS